MASIAELKIIVDTSQLEKAKKLLGELPQVTQSVAQATNNLGQANQETEKATDKLSKRAEALIRQTKELEATYKQGRAAVLDYRAAEEGVSDIIAPLTQSIRQQEAAIRANTEAKKAQMEIDKAVQKSIEGVDAARYNMIQSLQQEIATFGMSREEMLLWEAEIIGAKEQVAPLVAELQRLKAAKEAEAEASRNARAAAQGDKQSRQEAAAARQREAAAIEEKLRQQNLSRFQTEQEIRAEAERRVAAKYAREDSLRMANTKKIESQAHKAAREEIQKQREEYVKLRGQLDPVEKKYEELGQAMDKLRRQLSSGAISLEEFREAEAMVDRQIKQLDQLSKTSGKTAKEINFAMRGLPAQITDIFVSLQGGQRPLTVLLQQGGQIKDMFGGIGVAARAMGGYILGLLTPINILIGAFATVLYSVHRAQSQFYEFNRMVITTGGNLGVTAQGLRNVADDVSESTNKSISSVMKVLDLVSKQSYYVKIGLDEASEASIRWAKITKGTEEDFIQLLVRIAEEPLAAAQELTRRYGLLDEKIYATASTYAHLGEEAKAAELIQRALAEETSKRFEEAQKNATTMSKVFSSVTGFFSGTFQSVTDFFSKFSQATIDSVDNQIQSLERFLEVSKNLSSEERKNYEQRVSNLKAYKQSLIETSKAEEDASKERRRQLELQVKGQEALDRVLDAGRNSLSNAERIKEEIDLLNQAYEVLRETSMLTPEAEKAYQRAIALKWKEFDQELLIEDTRRKRREREEKDAKYRDDAATREILRIRERAAALTQQLNVGSRIGKEEAELAKLKQTFLDLEAKKRNGILTDEQESLLTNKEAILAEQEKNVALERQLALSKDIAKQESFTAALRLKEQADREKYADSLTGAGLSDKALERLRERNALQREYASEVAKIMKEYRESGNETLRDNNLSALQESMATRMNLLEDFYAKQDELRGDWQVGFKKAFSNYLEEGRNVANMTQSLFTNMFSGMEDAVVNFVTTGKFAMKDFVRNVLADLARMATRIATNQLLMMVISSFMPSAPTTQSTTINTGAQFSGFAAKGKAFSGGVEFFASGGTFTNSVVTRPTAFGTKRGLGVMGEAGPEAIMPLTRTSDGKLGVHAVGSAGSIVAPVSVVVNAESGPSAGVDSGSAASNGRAVQMAIKAECERAIRQGLMEGGSIWRAIRGR